MSQWVELCRVSDAPREGEAKEVDAAGRVFCLARHEGALFALDNVCPHRQGPLGQGWVEGGAVLCPWHAWAFDLHTGEAAAERSQVATFAVRTTGDVVEVAVE